MANAPLASRKAVGPKPSGGNRAAVEVIVTPSGRGQEGVPLVATEPEMVTVPPAGTTAGETATLPPVAEAGVANATATKKPLTTARATARVARPRCIFVPISLLPTAGPKLYLGTRTHPSMIFRDID
jgi:hypothetical protein